MHVLGKTGRGKKTNQIGNSAMGVEFSKEEEFMSCTSFAQQTFCFHPSKTEVNDRKLAKFAETRAQKNKSLRVGDWKSLIMQLYGF